MSPLTRRVAVLALIVTTAPVLADTTPAAPTKDQIAKWIKQLGDADFDVRQKASEKIWNATDDDTTPVIEAALKKALKSDDAEVVRRAGEILERLRNGTNAKTPKKIVDLVERFNSTEKGARQQAIQDLFESRAPGLKVLVKLIDAQKDPAVKDDLSQQIGTQASKAVPSLMADNDHAAVEALLDLGLRTNQPAARLSYAAYWFRRGKLDERIRILEATKPSNPEQHAALLASLYRVQRDFPKARAAVEATKNEELLNAILVDQGDWKELATRTAKSAVGSSNPDVLGLLARYQRLAGDDKRADETLVRIRENAKQVGHDQSPHALLLKQQSARALLLNDRPDDALPVISHGDGRIEAVQLLCARNQLKNAMKVFDAEAPRESAEPWGQFDVLRARTQFLLGDHYNAVKLFKSLAEKMDHRPDPIPGFLPSNVLPTLLPQTELQLGLKDLAFDHLTTVVAAEKNLQGLTFRFMSAFPDRDSAAAVWWQYFRHKHATDEPARTMKRVREIVDGRMPLKEFTALAEDVLQEAADLPREHWHMWYLGLADSCQDAKADALYQKCLEKAVEAITTEPKITGPFRRSVPRIRLGDFYAEKKNWTRAADNYASAWQGSGTNPLPVYLHGLALIQAGQEKEGKGLIELAHDLPLGDSALRFAFVLDLEQRGHSDAAVLECELIVRVNGVSDLYAESALQFLAAHAQIRKDYAQAANHYEHSLLCHLSRQPEYSQPVGYLLIPAAVHSNRAMAFLAADDRPDAQREIQSCLDILPGDINLAILVVPELEKKGHKKEAADLFAKVSAVHENLCKDYPKSSWAHNNAAWLAVRCRRNLDEVLKHAKLAVELAPDNAGYLDTFGEVYFQKATTPKRWNWRKNASSWISRMPISSANSNASKRAIREWMCQSRRNFK